MFWGEDEEEDSSKDMQGLSRKHGFMDESFLVPLAGSLVPSVVFFNPIHDADDDVAAAVTVVVEMVDRLPCINFNAISSPSLVKENLRLKCVYKLVWLTKGQFTI